jgi:hypothetical protein
MGKDLMANVLENERYLRVTHFSSEQVIMVVPQFYVSEMIPPTANVS